MRDTTLNNVPSIEATMNDIATNDTIMSDADMEKQEYHHSDNI